MANVLLVAFDGMDRRLIEKFGLENVRLDDFRELKVEGDVRKVMTNELFTSLITGKTFEDHGIVGMGKEEKTWKNRFLHGDLIRYLAQNVRGFYRLRQYMFKLLNAGGGNYTREDMKSDTVFDDFADTRDMFVPVYSNHAVQYCFDKKELLERGFSHKKISDLNYDMVFDYKKRQFFSELGNDIVSPRDFLMIHFFQPDHFQHYMGDKYINNYQESYLKKKYEDLDRFAGKVREKAELAGYDIVIFMSDHGLPSMNDHEPYAFISSNESIFDQNPSITDVREIINREFKK